MTWINPPWAPLLSIAAGGSGAYLGQPDDEFLLVQKFPRCASVADAVEVERRCGTELKILPRSCQRGLTHVSPRK